MEDKIKAISIRAIPYILVFFIGSFYGTSTTLYSIDQDCKLMGKTRMGEAVFSCEKK